MLDIALKYERWKCMGRYIGLEEFFGINSTLLSILQIVSILFWKSSS